jgi:hypothetical protein
MEINTIVAINVDSIKKGYIVLGKTIIKDVVKRYIKKMEMLAMEK